MSKEKKKWLVKTDGEIVTIEAETATDNGSELKFTTDGEVVAVFATWSYFRLLKAVKEE